MLIVMGCLVASALYATIRAIRKEKYFGEIISHWRRNPTKMDLSLATTKQILKELQTRPQPIILVLPEMPRVSGEPVKLIQVFVLGIHPTHARMILHGAGELLDNGGGSAVET
jgi:hypothetical protein